MSDAQTTPVRSAPRVIVIGAGIVGAAIADALARSGAQVLVLDTLPGAGGVATEASFAWINASSGNPKPYFDLRMRAISGWRALAERFPDGQIEFCGGLFFETQKLDEYLREHREWGYGLRPLSRDEIRKLEPALANPPEMALLATDEAMVEPSRFARKLIAASGADFSPSTMVERLIVEEGQVRGVVTPGSEIEADAVVLAAGAGSPALLETAGIRFEIDLPPGLLATTSPIPGKIRHVIVGPGLHFRQLPAGNLLAGSDFLGSHDISRPEETALALVDKLREALDVRDLWLQSYCVGHRPTPTDGFPAVGAVPAIAGLFVAVMHSGVTLAPAIGEMLASEVISGSVDPLLAPYRFARFVT